MPKFLRVLLGALCLFGFLYIRFRESAIFYDPLIDYYHGDYQNNPLPTFVKGKLFLHIGFRFTLNMLLSLLLLWVVFLDKQILKFTLVFYSVLGTFLMIVLYFLMSYYEPENYLPLFYVRRFLIQPLLIFLLLPAFFYSRRVNN